MSEKTDLARVAESVLKYHLRKPDGFQGVDPCHAIKALRLLSLNHSASREDYTDDMGGVIPCYSIGFSKFVRGDGEGADKAVMKACTRFIDDLREMMGAGYHPALFHNGKYVTQAVHDEFIMLPKIDVLWDWNSKVYRILCNWIIKEDSPNASTQGAS